MNSKITLGQKKKECVLEKKNIAFAMLIVYKANC